MHYPEHLPFGKTTIALLTDLNVQCKEVLANPGSSSKIFTCGEMFGLCRGFGLGEIAEAIVSRHFREGVPEYLPTGG